MLTIKALILGILQGLTEFFPISSSGHLTLVGHLMGVEIDLTLSIMLHIGSLAAIVFYFYQEMRHCTHEMKGICCDFIHNVKQFLGYRGINEEPVYVKVVSNNYRKLTLMLFVAMLPTVVIAALLCPVTEYISGNLLCSGVGLMVTALVLLVASYVEKNKKGPREAKWKDALLVGCFQGFAVFPGVSRLGMTLSASFISGFTSKFSRIYCFLISIPTIAGAMILEGCRQNWTAASIGFFPSLIGMIAAFAVGYMTISKAMKIISFMSVRKFSIYCACMGMVSIIVYMF